MSSASTHDENGPQESESEETPVPAEVGAVVEPKGSDIVVPNGSAEAAGNGGVPSARVASKPSLLMSINWRYAIFGGGWLLAAIGVLVSVSIWGYKTVIESTEEAAANGVKSALSDRDSPLNQQFEEIAQEIDSLKTSVVAQNLDAKLDEIEGRFEQIETLLGAKPGRPKAVFVVLPAEGPGADAARDMRDGIRSQAGGDSFRIVSNDGGNQSRTETVRIIDIEDHDDFARTIADLELAEDRYECVLVLGHSDSTKAKELCDRYYERKGIPVVLLGPTNPSITRSAIERGRPLFLRLLPTDRVQTQAIVDVVRRRAYSRVTIYWDGNNELYSDYIRREIERSLDDSTVEVRSIKVQSETARQIEFANDHRRYDPELIVCVSLTASAMAVMEGWDPQDWRDWNPGDPDPREDVDVIVTDGCTSADFCDFLRGQTSWRRVLLLSPMPKPLVGNGRELVDYKPLGVIAAAICQEMLERAFLNRMITRSAVAAQIHDFMIRPQASLRIRQQSSKEPIEIPWELTVVDFRGSDLFGTVDGDNRAWKYHYYGTDTKGQLRHLGNETTEAVRYLDAGL